MAVSDWSTTPASNTTLEGINVAENCPAGNINNVIRAMAAAIRVMYNNLPSVADYLKKDGTVAATGQLTHSGRGAYLHHNSTANTSGRIFVQAAGGTVPSMADGDILIEY